MKILFTTPILEYPPAGGPQLRIANTIKVLSAVSSLDVLFRSDSAAVKLSPTLEPYRKMCSSLHILSDLPASKTGRFIQRIQRRLTGRERPPYLKEILKFVKVNKPDVIWFGFGNISYQLIKEVRKALPRIPIVCDTDSVWSRFILRELPYASGTRKEEIETSGRLKEEEERQWVNLCNVTTAVSEVDAEYYRRIANNPDRIHIFSNVIDLSDYANVQSRPHDIKSPSVYLAGSYWPNSPMSLATRWLINNVMPLVRAKYPTVTLYIIGRGSDEEFGAIADVHTVVKGRVLSVLPYLCHADIALVPLHFESGTRFKILEAGACSIPIVSTALGAEGLPLVNGRDILIADDPQSFADAIVKLLQDPGYASELASSCHRLISRDFGLPALKADAESILEYLFR